MEASPSGTVRISVKDTFHVDPSMESHGRLVARARKLGLKIEGCLVAGVTVCVTGRVDASTISSGTSTQTGQSRGRRRDRIHRMVIQAQTEPQDQQQSLRDSIVERACTLDATTVSGPTFQRWLRALEMNRSGGIARDMTGEGRQMVRPTIPQTRRIGTRPDRFKSSEHPRVVIKDLDGLEADRIQALPPELLRKCNIHQDAPPGICPFTPREQWEREVLKYKKNGTKCGAATGKNVVGMISKSSQKLRRGGWCECCERQYIGTTSEHCASDEHKASVASDRNYAALLALVGWKSGAILVDVAQGDGALTVSTTREPDEVHARGSDLPGKLEACEAKGDHQGCRGEAIGETNGLPMAVGNVDTIVLAPTPSQPKCQPQELLRPADWTGGGPASDAMGTNRPFVVETSPIPSNADRKQGDDAKENIEKTMSPIRAEIKVEENASCSIGTMVYGSPLHADVTPQRVEIRNPGSGEHGRVVPDVHRMPRDPRDSRPASVTPPNNDCRFSGPGMTGVSEASHEHEESVVYARGDAILNTIQREGASRTEFSSLAGAEESLEPGATCPRAGVTDPQKTERNDSAGSFLVGQRHEQAEDEKASRGGSSGNRVDSHVTDEVHCAYDIRVPCDSEPSSLPQTTETTVPGDKEASSSAECLNSVNVGLEKSDAAPLQQAIFPIQEHGSLEKIARTEEGSGHGSFPLPPQQPVPRKKRVRVRRELKMLADSPGFAQASASFTVPSRPRRGREASNGESIRSTGRQRGSGPNQPESCSRPFLTQGEGEAVRSGSSSKFGSPSRSCNPDPNSCWRSGEDVDGSSSPWSDAGALARVADQSSRGNKRYRQAHGDSSGRSTTCSNTSNNFHRERLSSTGTRGSWEGSIAVVVNDTRTVSEAPCLTSPLSEYEHAERGASHPEGRGAPLKADLVVKDFAYGGSQSNQSAHEHATVTDVEAVAPQVVRTNTDDCGTDSDSGRDSDGDSVMWGLDGDAGTCAPNSDQGGRSTLFSGRVRTKQCMSARPARTD